MKIFPKNVMILTLFKQKNQRKFEIHVMYNRKNSAAQANTIRWIILTYLLILKNFPFFQKVISPRLYLRNSSGELFEIALVGNIERDLFKRKRALQSSRELVKQSEAARLG